VKDDIFIFNEGRLSRKDNTLFFESFGQKKYIPIESVNGIYAFGELDFNKSLLELLAEREVLLHYFNYYGYYTGSFYPREHLNSGFVILKQAEFYLDNEKRLDIAFRIIHTAMDNIIVVLKYYYSRGKELADTAHQITALRNGMEGCKTTEQLMALEGNVRDLYYKAFNVIMEDPQFKFNNRTRRPPKDRINALISFGNSILYTIVLGEIYQTMLDPRISYLHTTNSRRFSLNLDMAEIFKPIVVDRTIFTLINKKILSGNDFEKELGGIILNNEGKKKFIKELNNKLASVIKHKELNMDVSYKRLIRLELYKLQKHITEDRPFEGFVAKW